MESVCPLRTGLTVEPASFGLLLRAPQILGCVHLNASWWSPWWLSGKEPTCQCRRQNVGSLIHEDPTCRAITKPASPNSCACALEPGNYTHRAHVPYSLCPATRSHCNERPPQHNQSIPCSLQLEKGCAAMKSQHSQKSFS